LSLSLAYLLFALWAKLAALKRHTSCSQFTGCAATADIVRAAQIAGSQNGGIKNDFKIILK
jgi:hypothetical protein